MSTTPTSTKSPTAPETKTTKAPTTSSNSAKTDKPDKSDRPAAAATKDAPPALATAQDKPLYPAPPAAKPAPVDTRTESYVRMPLPQILFRFDWNARSPDDVMRTVPGDGALVGYDAEAECTGMGGGLEKDKIEPGLIDMILLQGQLSPADVRVNTDPKTKDACPVSTVDGFRRGTALGKIAEMAQKDPEKLLLLLEQVHKGDKTFQLSKDLIRHPILRDPTWDAFHPTMKCIVREMTEVEARVRNLNGGTGAHLSTPDLAFGVEELRRASQLASKRGEGVELLPSQIASQIGKSKTLVSQMMKIMRMSPVITSHWRRGGTATIGGRDIVSVGPLGLTLMYELAGLDVTDDEREIEYAKLVMATRPQGGTGASPERRKLDSAIKKAKHVGEVLAWAKVNIGDLTQNIPPKRWELLVENLIGFTRPSGRPVTEAQTRQLVDAARDAYKAEEKHLTDPEDGEEDEDEEQNQKKRDKR